MGENTPTGLPFLCPNHCLNRNCGMGTDGMTNCDPEGLCLGTCDPNGVCVDRPGAQLVQALGCENCHGGNLVGQGMAPCLRGFDIDAADCMRNRITCDGPGIMPAFCKTDLTVSEVESLITYLMGLSDSTCGLLGTCRAGGSFTDCLSSTYLSCTP